MRKTAQIDILAELRAHIARKYINQTGAAAAWGCSKALVSAVVRGTKQPNETMLNDAGFKRITVNEVRYERV